MSTPAELKLPNQTLELPVVVGTENEHAVDITKLRGQTGFITLDSGYGNTGACQSSVCYIDGEKGILRYRGYPIEQLAEKSSFLEVAHLLIWGELPNASELEKLRTAVAEHARLPEALSQTAQSYASTGHPMASLSSMINAYSGYDATLEGTPTEEGFFDAAAKLISTIRTMAAYIYQNTQGQTPGCHIEPSLDYCSDLLQMMFATPSEAHDVDADIITAMNKILILHAEHEQNCSTSTVRMVGSSQANLFASASAGVCALWGPLHGGANVAVLKMLEEIQSSGVSVQDYMQKVKDKTSGIRLMGFGHRVYKNFDPRAKILKGSADTILSKLGVNDPLLAIAKELETVALNDSYFIERKLYPNVDFYSGIIMRAMGIPTNMFTVMFAIGRMPGWIAHWYEVFSDPNSRINRPRQVYTGSTERDYVAIDQRG